MYDSKGEPRRVEHPTSGDCSIANTMEWAYAAISIITLQVVLLSSKSNTERANGKRPRNENVTHRKICCDYGLLSGGRVEEEELQSYKFNSSSQRGLLIYVGTKIVWCW